MERVKVTLEEIAGSQEIDRARVDATTEDDIRRHMVEDGFDPEKPFHGLREIMPVETLRIKAGLTQAEMAMRLRVPLETWRTWERDDRAIDPTVRSFLKLVADDPERAFRVLGE